MVPNAMFALKPKADFALFLACCCQGKMCQPISAPKKYSRGRALDYWIQKNITSFHFVPFGFVPNIVSEQAQKC